MKNEMNVNDRLGLIEICKYAGMLADSLMMNHEYPLTQEQGMCKIEEAVEHAALLLIDYSTLDLSEDTELLFVIRTNCLKVRAARQTVARLVFSRSM